MTNPCCENCKFRIETLCRRYPPQIVATVHGDAGGIYSNFNDGYPNIEMDFWCGEYQPDKKDPKTKIVNAPKVPST